MTIKDVINLYEKYQQRYGNDAYKHISALLSEAKAIHYRDFLKHPTPKNDHEQSWKGFKGNALVEVDLDGAYVMTEQPVIESKKVKTFDKFINDLKKLLK